MDRRHKTHAVKVGHVTIGGDAPIVVQSMTDTDTADVQRTVEQIRLLADAGSEIVRVTVNSEEAAEQPFQLIYEELARSTIAMCQLWVIFINNGHTLLTKYDETARLLHKYRINPGNVGFGNKKDDRFSTP